LISPPYLYCSVYAGRECQKAIDTLTEEKKEVKEEEVKVEEKKLPKKIERETETVSCARGAVHE